MNTQSESGTYYQLSTAATLTGLTTGRVRRFIRHGLVHPPRVEGRRVLLGEAELAQLRRIRRLSDDLGLNLAGIEVTLNLLEQLARLQATNTERKRSR